MVRENKNILIRADPGAQYAGAAHNYTCSVLNIVRAHILLLIEVFTTPSSLTKDISWSMKFMFFIQIFFKSI